MKNTLIASMALTLFLSGAGVADSINIEREANNNRLLQFAIKPLLSARISVADGSVWAQVGQTETMKLEPLDPFLWRNYANIYLKHNDYNHDGLQDVAVLTSVGYSPEEVCYNVYYFHPASQRFVKSGGAMRCGLH